MWTDSGNLAASVTINKATSGDWWPGKPLEAHAPRSISIIVRATPPGKISGGVALPKTLKELKANPELLAAEFPGIHAALQELPERFRQMAQNVQNSIITLVRPPIPQITLSPLLLDLIAAAQRDRAAIARLSKQRSALEQMPRDLLVDAILWPPSEQDKVTRRRRGGQPANPPRRASPTISRSLPVRPGADLV